MKTDTKGTVHPELRAQTAETVFTSCDISATFSLGNINRAIIQKDSRREAYACINFFFNGYFDSLGK